MAHLLAPTRPSHWPDLALCLMAGQTLHKGVPVRPGLSIGRERENDIQIDSPFVDPVHAVVCQSGPEPVLRASGLADLVLPDGTGVESLVLVQGLSFCIGPATIYCMANVPSPRSGPAAEPGRCGSCQADVSRLPLSARFCPRCGRMIDSEPLPTAQMPRVFIPSEHRPHSVMLKGYASAMAGLGERYEAGAGVQRNEREAVRCFLKAARLGSPKAADRLEEKGIEVRPARPSESV